MCHHHKKMTLVVSNNRRIMRSLFGLVEYLYEEGENEVITLRRDGLEIEYKKLTFIKSVDNSTGGRGVFAANVTRTE